jgi:DNA helicase-2/ATP-dependent DNA helicase PcrA
MSEFAYDSLRQLASDNEPSQRAIADLVRAMVHARRGVSVFSVEEWISSLLSHAKIARETARRSIASVIQDLVATGDICRGHARGEDVLCAAPERFVLLPDGTIIALGDHGLPSAAPGRMFPTVEGGATTSIMTLLSEIGLPNERPYQGHLQASGKWVGTQPIPPVLRLAFCLCGEFNPETGAWSIGEQNASFLNDWFGLSSPADDASSKAIFDESQRAVVAADAGARLVVEAGPGAGKTHVACERVAALVKDGAAPSRILLLSFTRTAVAELRARIGVRLEGVSNARGVRVATFDSFSGRLTASAQVSAHGGFDANIRAATRLLRSGNPAIEADIAMFEHVVIDEAQDLVDDRKELCLALIALLRPVCGVTVFGDFAQAIYDYQAQGGAGGTLIEALSATSEFHQMRLELDHRTKTEALAQMYQDVRGILREAGPDPKAAYFAVREKIREAATEDGVKNWQAHPSISRGLILARSRKGLLSAAEAMRNEGRRFRLRQPDRPVCIEPWIGALLAGLAPATRVTAGAFRDLWNDLHPAPEAEPEWCWSTLLDLDGSGREYVVVGHIAEALLDPDPELVREYEGSSGPLLSTIHGVKGRQDERVMLLLNQAPRNDHVDWGEEARILYVGATRASHELRTAWINPRKYYTTDNHKRHWWVNREFRALEIGLDGDLLDWRDFRRDAVDEDRAVVDAIWQAAAAGGPAAEARCSADGALRVHVAGADGLGLAQLSESFLETVQRLRQVSGDAQSPDRITNFYITGAATVVTPGIGDEMPELALIPLLGGLARISR